MNASDDVNDGACDVGHCSLREAITAANHDAVGGIIHFSIPGAGPHSIQPLWALPPLEWNVIIDGTSEPDFAGIPVIELDGSLAGNAHGLDLVGSQNLIRGLVINRFSWNGVSINTDCTFNVVEGNTLGGSQPGAGNIIANATWVGVALFVDAGNQNKIQSNSIFDSAALGIELNRDGVTVNDEGDADTGPNNLQNYPVLTSVLANGGAAVQAALNSSPSSSYTLDFFSNTACDETGFGEGKTPLGTAALTTDASGNGTVATSFASITGTILTITATAQGGAFEETVALTCSGAPSGTTCTFQADELDLSPGQASTTMTVTTVAPASSVLIAPRRVPWDPPGWPWAALIVLAGGAVLLRELRRPGPDARKRKDGEMDVPQIRWGAWACLGAILVVLAASCGKDGTSPPTGETSSGSYELTVTATWESVSQATTATLVVQ